MKRSRNEAGEGRAGCVFWILLAIVLGLVAKEVLPVKAAAIKLEDHMKDLAMTQPRKPKSFFEKAIFKKAQSLELNIDRKQIRVKKFPERVVMDVQITAPVNVLGFTYDWNISIHVDRDLFLL